MRERSVVRDGDSLWELGAGVWEAERRAERGGVPEFELIHAGGQALLARNLDRQQIASKGLAYEKLDQLTTEVLLVR